MMGKPKKKSSKGLAAKCAILTAQRDAAREQLYALRDVVRDYLHAREQMEALAYQEVDFGDTD